MRIVVLGSSGQIGRALVRQLRLEGNTVTEFDIKNGYHQDLRSNCNANLSEAIKDSNFVYFLAFDVGGSKYLASYQETPTFISNNMRIMENTFTEISRFNKPFIFASTQMSNLANSNYGLLKAIGEAYTQSLGGLTVKFWNTYGTEDDDEKTHVITDFIRGANSNRIIRMRTNGLEQRQFLHADDCSVCLVRLRSHYGNHETPKDVHITSFKWVNILTVAKIVAKCFHGTVIIPGECTDSLQNGIKNEPSRWILNYWNPKIDLEEGIRLVIASMGIR